MKKDNLEHKAEVNPVRATLPMQPIGMEVGNSVTGAPLYFHPGPDNSSLTTDGVVFCTKGPGITSMPLRELKLLVAMAEYVREAEARHEKPEK